jgi:hypothetical protein
MVGRRRKARIIYKSPPTSTSENVGINSNFVIYELYLNHIVNSEFNTENKESHVNLTFIVNVWQLTHSSAGHALH